MAVQRDIFRPCGGDAVFLLLAAAWALFGLWAVEILSSGGLEISGDLCCYAQNLAGDAHRHLFAADPLLARVTPANSIPNLESALAAVLQPGDNVAQGLFRAAAAAVFFHYASCYFLGRRILGHPLVAALLALLLGVTVWVDFGSYWGMGTGDVTPRVFFGALFPLLLLGALAALDRPGLRPVVLLAAGCGIYLHGISSLVVSCMLFTVFFFHRARGATLGGHAATLLLSLAAWAAPTLYFLQDALLQQKVFSAGDLAVLQQVFDRRFLEDHGGLWQRLLGHFSPSADAFPILWGGLAGYFLVRRHGTPRMQRLASVMPALALGLCLVLLLSVGEGLLAQRLGRLPMGQELVRGIRFLIPLGWLMAVCAFCCLWWRFPRCGALAALTVMACVLAFDQGRWSTAVRFGFREALGMEQPAAVRQTLARGAQYREALEALGALAPKDAPIFAAPDAMAVRYVLRRPLAYAFKDGSSYLYNADAAGAAAWLALTGILDREGSLAAWEASGAEWLLSGHPEDSARAGQGAAVLWRNKNWFIARRTAAAGPVREEGTP